jgi:hypothetical protein
MLDDVLTPLKPEWKKFTNELVFHLHIVDCGDDSWNSSCDATFRISRNIIENRFPQFNVEKTIDYFKKSQWFCDCDVFSESPMYLGESDKIPLGEINATT